MDPISLVSSLVALGSAIAAAAETAERNRKRSKSLSSRAQAILEVVTALQAPQIAARDVLLRELMDVLTAVLLFLRKFQQKKYLAQLWSRNSDSEQFVAFDEELLHLQVSLNLAVTIDADARAAQSMKDAVADIRSDIEGVRRQDSQQLASDLIEEVRLLLSSCALHNQGIVHSACASASQIEAVRAVQARGDRAEAHMEEALRNRDNAGAASCLSMMGEPRYLDGAALMISEQEPLGLGTFGSVFRGYYNGASVAVKIVERYRLAASVRESLALRRELLVHQQLSVSPHIVHLYGAVQSDRDIKLVLELCAMSLASFIHDQPLHEKSADFPTCVRVLLQLCSGIQYLHSCGVLH